MKRKRVTVKNRILWEKSLGIAAGVLSIKKQILNEDTFGLGQLLLRSSAGVLASVGEIYTVEEASDKVRLLSIAQGAVSECIKYLRIASEQGVSNTGTLIVSADQLSVLLESYIKALRQ